jgi:hypothetical protein
MEIIQNVTNNNKENKKMEKVKKSMGRSHEMGRKKSSGTGI